MIWITGDMHGEPESFKRKGMNKMKKGDCLIVCGDFGFIWNGDEKEDRMLERIGKLPYKVLFVDGCHENYTKLATYPVEMLYQAKARHISGNLYQLMRGEIYRIEGKKVFAFGGGYSRDQELRLPANFWWEEETPTVEDVENAFYNLKANQFKVDLVVTHDVPQRLLGLVDNNRLHLSGIHSLLEQMTTKVEFQMWYFGKYHTDRRYPPKYQNVFTSVIPALLPPPAEKAKKKRERQKKEAKGKKKLSAAVAAE